MGGHPLNVLGEPLLDAVPIGRRHGDLVRRARHFHQVQGVDNPGAAPREAPVDGLGVLQIGIHAGGRVHEPGAQMQRRVVGVLALAGNLVGGRQRRHDEAQADHGAAVLDEIVGVAHAVALDVRPAGILGVGPPIVAFGKEIVRPSGAARRAGGGDGDRLGGKIFAGGLEDPRTLDGGEVELRRPAKHFGGRPGEGRGDELAAEHRLILSLKNGVAMPQRRPGQSRDRQEAVTGSALPRSARRPV